MKKCRFYLSFDGKPFCGLAGKYLEKDCRGLRDYCQEITLVAEREKVIAKNPGIQSVFVEEEEERKIFKGGEINGKK